MMTTFDDSSLWRRDPALPFQAMDEEIIVVDPGTRQVHLLNATAARIWTLLASAQSLPALVATLEEEFEAPAPELRTEIEAFLAEMSEKRLCAPQPAAPSER
jgi:PqqD family protein of HPr-rel-A system